MIATTVAGQSFHFEPDEVEEVAAALDPEPIAKHYVVVGGRRLPPKQVLAALTGLERADFTTHQARSILRRLGFGVFCRGHNSQRTRSAAGQPTQTGSRRGAEAEMLAPHVGQWIAQDGLEVLYVADSPEAVVRWLRRKGLRARVWRVPDSPRAAGSALSIP